jgi:hypothetical protein
VQTLVHATHFVNQHKNPQKTSEEKPGTWKNFDHFPMTNARYD